MSIKQLLRSFAGGEITPELFGRPDLAKFQTGLAQCENFVVLPHGPITNRAGWKWVIETKDSTKSSVLIPFIYSTTQAYVLEFGDQYMRIHTQGGTVLEANKNITEATQANPCALKIVGHGHSVGDWIYVASVGGMTQLNGRYLRVDTVPDADHVTLEDMAGATINSTGYGAYTSGGTAARVYEIATPYLEADLFDLHYTQSADVLTIVHQSYQQRELKRLGATNWTLTTFTLQPTITAPNDQRVAATVGTGTTRYRYLVTSIATDGLEESLRPTIEATMAPKNITAITLANPGVATAASHGIVVNDLTYVKDFATNGMVEFADGYYQANTVPTVSTISFKTVGGAAINTTGYTAYDGTGATVAECGIQNDLATAGNKNTVTWTNVSGAIRYNIYKYANGVWGYIGQAADGALGFVDDNITPDNSRCIPEEDNPFTGSGNYPGAVGYFKGRRWFAGTSNKPQNLWGTRSGQEANMTYSIPTRDDDRIAVRLTARQANTIRHIVPVSDMLLFTSGAEWLITSQNTDAITAVSIDYKVQGYVGASNVQPIVTNRSVLYAQDRGGRVREMLYKWESQGYDTNDVSIMAPHLFDGYSITSMAYARSPSSVCWAVRDDGKLLGCTYVPEHQVVGWHQHSTNGLHEAVAAIPESQEDALYGIIQRTLGGRTVRSVEAMSTRLFASLEDCFFIDAGLTYDGVATSTVTGLWHLEGETVSGLADGAVFKGKVVAGGSITLDTEASLVHIGLPYVCDAKSLPLALEMQALGQGTNKNVNKVYLRVKDSSGIFAGPSVDRLTQFKQRTTEPYGSPPNLVTGEMPIVIAASWNEAAQVCVRQADSLPVTILSMTLEVELGG
ncbi:MAG: hypothetical protein IT456_10590 [Planctomycetes bacterium]|nr:hypothetical protein [Planctomycetota bacterium]